MDLETIQMKPENVSTSHCSHRRSHRLAAHSHWNFQWNCLADHNWLRRIYVLIDFLPLQRPIRGCLAIQLEWSGPFSRLLAPDQTHGCYLHCTSSPPAPNLWFPYSVWNSTHKIYFHRTEIDFDESVDREPLWSAMKHWFSFGYFGLITFKITFAHSSAYLHSFLFNFKSGAACLRRNSLWAFKQSFSNSLNVEVLSGRLLFSDCDRRIRCSVFVLEAGDVAPHLASPFVVAALPFVTFFSFFTGLRLCVDTESDWAALDAFDRRKCWAHGDFCASDSTISCFSFMTIVRSGLWPLYVWIVS